MIKRLHSYGLQPGSGLILAAFVGMVKNLDVTDYFVYIIESSNSTSTDHDEPAESQSENGSMELGVGPAFVILLMLEMIVDGTCLVYGTIIKGNRRMLQIWRIFKIIYMTIFCIFICITFLMIILFYVPSKSAEGISKSESEVHDRIHSAVLLIFISGLYVWIYLAVWYWYEINLAGQCIPLVSPASMTELEPIGKGSSYILDYFRNDPRSTASLVLMTEIMFNVHEILSRHVTEYGIGHDYGDEISRSTIMTLENTLVRYIRVVVSIVGFFFVYQGAHKFMFKWCLAYGLNLLISLGFFLYLMFMWSAAHIVLTVLHLVGLSISLVYRAGVIYFCLRYSGVISIQQPSLPL